MKFTDSGAHLFKSSSNSLKHFIDKMVLICQGSLFKSSVRKVCSKRLEALQKKTGLYRSRLTDFSRIFCSKILFEKVVTYFKRKLIFIDQGWPIFRAYFVRETAEGWYRVTCRIRRCGPDRCVPASCWGAGAGRPDCIPGWPSGDIPPSISCSSTAEASERGLKIAKFTLTNEFDFYRQIWNFDN